MLQRQALLNANPLLHGLEANLPLLDCILIPTKMEIFDHISKLKIHYNAKMMNTQPQPNNVTVKAYFML